MDKSPGRGRLLRATQKATDFGVPSTAALASGALDGRFARRLGLIAWPERFTAVVLFAFGLCLVISGAHAGR